MAIFRGDTRRTTCSARRRFKSPLIHLGFTLWLIGSFAGIDIVALASSDHLAQHRVPPPQPASPPTPNLNFDQHEGPDDPAHFAAPPSPASPPTPHSQPESPSRREKPSPGSVPASSHEPYSGKEYRFKKFVIRPAQLKLEGLLFFTLIIYIFMGVRGRSKNERAVARWWNLHSEMLHKEFTHVGTGSADGYISNGPASFYGYATGRQGCQSLTIRFALRPRQDIPFMIYEELRAAIDLSWTGRSDRLELVWSLSPGNRQKSFEAKDLFVWALVEKRVMNTIREDRWDVRTFTEVKESSQLPSQLVFMSESGETTEQIIRNKELGFVQWLQKNQSSLEWFDSLVLSGTQQTQPEISDLPLPPTPSSRTLTLRLRLPPPSRMLDPLPLVQFCFNLIDTLDQGISFTALSATKFTKRRAEVSNLMLDEEKKMVERTKEEERRKRLKAAQDAKISKMSAAEQRKHDERERKRNAAKIGKATVKHK